jgi:hypothetical protein
MADLAKLAESDGSAYDNDAKRQHFVPQLLLRGFSDESDDKRPLYQLNTKTGKPQRTSVEAAASRRYFYAITNEDGTRNNRLEGFFARIESHAAPALKRLLDEPLALSAGDRATLSFFLAVQTHRTPAGIAQGEKLANVVLRLLVGTESFSDLAAFQETYRKIFGEDDKTPDEIEDFRRRTIRSVREGKTVMVDPGGAALTSGLEIVPEQAFTIYQMSWTILRGEGGFVTSDRSFAMHDPTPIYPWSANGLLSSPHAQTTIPLSDKACLLLTPDGDELGVDDNVTADDVTTLNMRTYGWADEYIFGKSQLAVTAVRAAAKARPGDIVRPKPQNHVVLLDPDPTDDSLANANTRRGWPPRLVYEGVAHDYVVVPHDRPAPEIQELVDRIVEERARKSMGLPKGVRPPGQITTATINPWDLN